MSDALSPAARSAAFVILAAGKGTRMRSDTPKTLHPVAGLPMVGHALRLAAGFDPLATVVVTGSQAEVVGAAARALAPEAAIVLQEPQLGTGHAVAQAQGATPSGVQDVFILYGDTPLVRPETLARMSEARAAGAAVVVLGFEAAVPGGYGRLITASDGALEAIVEAKDATSAQRAVTLSNSGVMCVDGSVLFGLLDRVGNINANGEYYLTDIVALARADDLTCAVASCPENEVLGVNSRVELAGAEAAWQTRRRQDAMIEGASLIAPDTVFFSYDTVVGRDVVIEPNVVFGPGVTLDDEAHVRAFSHLEGCRVAGGAVVGPYARLRPGANVGSGARVGNFVEVKNADLRPGAKVNHLTYVGDAEVGARANIGAGTITCNYDGYLKHKTVIGDGAFIGSNSALVAPVTIGDGAIVAAGSTVVNDVPADALALARGKQENRPGLAARLRETLAAAKARKSARPRP